MVFLRTLLNFIFAGALLGLLGASFFGPRYLTWDNTPGAGKALCDCAENTRQTADKLIYSQLVGGGVGAGAGLAAGVAFVWMRRKKAGSAASTPVAPATKV